MEDGCHLPGFSPPPIPKNLTPPRSEPVLTPPPPYIPIPSVAGRYMSSVVFVVIRLIQVVADSTGADVTDGWRRKNRCSAAAMRSHVAASPCPRQHGLRPVLMVVFVENSVQNSNIKIYSRGPQPERGECGQRDHQHAAAVRALSGTQAFERPRHVPCPQKQPHLH